ncbi:MAG: FtsQ-type POTRA domain-containing protein [Actinomycetota bacterium]
MTGPIDPRLRQRRIAVLRAEGRRRLRIVLIVLGVITVGAGAYAITRSTALDLDRIEVAGASASRADDVIAATGLELGTPLLDVDLDTARAGVTALPWVKEVDIARSWPGTVTVDVVRRQPLALVPSGDGGSVVIDAEGVAIDRIESQPADDLPVITVVARGELGDVQTFALPAIPVIQLVPADLMPWIETYGIDYTGEENGELVLDLTGSAIAELGIGTDLIAKLDALRTVIGRVDRTCITVIDLRIAELPVVQRDADCEIDEPES